MTSDTERWSFAKFRQSERTASRIIEGKAIVIAIDHNQLHVLNSVATRVWQLLDGRFAHEIVAAIVGEFEVEPAKAQRDVERFLAELLATGALQIDEQPRAHER